MEENEYYYEVEDLQNNSKTIIRGYAEGPSDYAEITILERVEKYLDRDLSNVDLGKKPRRYLVRGHEVRDNEDEWEEFKKYYYYDPYGGRFYEDEDKCQANINRVLKEIDDLGNADLD